MKNLKFIFIISLSLLLTNCSSDDASETDNNDNLIADAFTKSIDENPTNGFVIGTITATSTNQTAITYRLKSEKISGALALSSTGELSVKNNSLFDYEKNTEITATYTATNGDLSKEGNITISIKNLRDTPFQYKIKPILFDGDYVGTFGGFDTVNGQKLAYDITIDWGDGSPVEQITDIANVSHIYDDNNLYTISLSGKIPHLQIGVNGLSLAQEIVQWGEVEWQNLDGAFANNPALQITATDVPDLSKVNALTKTFENCTNLNTGNFNDWDISNITSLFETFRACMSFNQDLNQWDTSNIISLTGTFRDARNFNGNITAWDVRKVTHMTNLFSGTFKFNQDIGQWKTNSLTRIGGIFGAAIIFNQDISSWDVSKVTDMTKAFTNANAFNQNISNWDVSMVVRMGQMFNDARNFNQNLSNWNVAKVTDCRDFSTNSALPLNSLPNFTNCNSSN